jgi:hypothetical protein
MVVEGCTMTLRALHNFLVTVVMCLATTSTLADTSPPPAKKPATEVTVVSMPPATLAQPVEVKVTSMPAVPPPELKVVLPADESTRNLVKATWWLVSATALLAIATFVVAWFASKDSKRRDKEVMMRDVSRSAHKVMVEVARLKKLAQSVPTARTQLHILAGQGGLPPEVKEQTEKDLQGRLKSLDAWNEEASFVITDQSGSRDPILRMSDKELASRLWRLDTLLIRLDGMREDVTQELEQYGSESSMLRQQRTAMQAAVLGGKLSQPSKNKLGE